MARTPRRPCLGLPGHDCTNLAEPGKPRCVPCEQQHRSISKAHYRGNWTQISKAARAHHLATVGPLCPGWRRPPHQVPARDLTTDHVDPRSLAQGVMVACRSCNSSRRDNTMNDELVCAATIDVDGQRIAIMRTAASDS